MLARAAGSFPPSRGRRLQSGVAGELLEYFSAMCCGGAADLHVRAAIAVVGPGRPVLALAVCHCCAHRDRANAATRPSLCTCFSLTVYAGIPFEASGQSPLDDAHWPKPFAAAGARTIRFRTAPSRERTSPAHTRCPALAAWAHSDAKKFCPGIRVQPLERRWILAGTCLVRDRLSAPSEPGPAAVLPRWATSLFSEDSLHVGGGVRGARRFPPGSFSLHET